ncbi:MAG: CoA pyrophosphatase [Bacteroidota bacterium]|nr:CoA pyrophosphatase [Bacteroidota bacterium]
MLLNTDGLKQKLKQPLPGVTSHQKMAPRHRFDESSEKANRLDLAKNSAVLVLLFPEKGKLKTVLIKRSEYEGVHSGQISFPGGQYGNTDKSFETTALRETYEEIGVEKDKIQIIGQLSDLYIPPSNFLVKVFVGYAAQKPEYIPDTKEVQSVIEVNIDEFYDSQNKDEKDFYSTFGKIKVNAPYYKINDIEIWGATAMIVTELLDILKS